MGKIRWRPWSEADRWDAALAYRQHVLAVELNRVLDNLRPPRDDCRLPDPGRDEMGKPLPVSEELRAEREVALAAHCGMHPATFRKKLAGRDALNARELMAWISVAGIDALPPEIAALHPPDEDVDDGSTKMA